MRNLAILLLCSVTAFSQQQDAIKLSSRLYDANYNMDFAAVVEMTYPEAVEQMGGPAMFADKLDKEFQNDIFRRRLQLTAPIFQVGPVTSINSAQFCVVSYRNPTRIFYEEQLDEKAMSAEVENWKKIASTKDVFPEPNRNSINVKRISKFVAVKDASTNQQWKFFNFDDVAQAAVFEKLFGADTKKQLGL